MDNQDLRLELKTIDMSSLVDKMEKRLLEVFMYKEREEIVNAQADHLNSILFDADHEFRFHGKLYRITGNDTLANFQSLLLPVFHPYCRCGTVTSPAQLGPIR